LQVDDTRTQFLDSLCDGAYPCSSENIHPNFKRFTAMTEKLVWNVNLLVMLPVYSLLGSDATIRDFHSD
jgi:hypothetical protein